MTRTKLLPKVSGPPTTGRPGELVRMLACVLAVGLVTGTLQAQESSTQPAPGGELRPLPSKTPEGGKTEPGKAPTTQPAGPQSPGGGGGGGFGDMKIIWIMLGVMVLLYVWMGRSRKKQEAKRKEMLGALKKGDKITTIGGIIGTVIEARESEVVVKVDESNNVRMRFARWAVRGVGEEAKAEKPEDKDHQTPQEPK